MSFSAWNRRNKWWKYGRSCSENDKWKTRRRYYRKFTGLTELVGKRMDRDQDQLLLNKWDITPGIRFFQVIENLKRTGVSITENFMTKRMEQLNKAREEHGFTNVWTTDDRILFKHPNENKNNLFHD